MSALFTNITYGFDCPKNKKFDDYNEIIARNKC